MSDKRRAEIEAKRAKLAELRKARADRQRAETERRQSETIGPSTAARRDIDDFVNTLIGNSRGGFDSTGDVTPSSSLPGTPPRQSALLHSSSALSPSGRVSRQSDVGSDRLSMGLTMVASTNSATDHVMERVLTPRSIDLIDVEQELFELPQRERVIYNKEVQTTIVEPEAPSISEEDIRQQILRERELEADRIAREKELEEESVQLEKEIEQEIRDLTEEERASILTAPEFLDFVEQSSKIVQRALNDGYDYIRDYTIGTEANGDDSEGKRVKRVCAFYDERYGKNRSITDVDWSPKYPELSVASYNKNPAALNEPDGIVAVWNLHLLERPEFVFHSQSDVLSVTFSPFHSNLMFGGTYSGQILLWDTRSKHLPVLKTPLSAAGHTHPVYAMRMVGTQNAHNLITSSTDGTVCSWLVDMLAQPQETLELVHAGHNKTGEVAITTLDFPDNETTTFWVGTEEGNVYQANRYDRAGAKAGLNQYDIYKGHAGPIMGLDFHPLVGPVDFSDLFLTASVDWTVKLWRAKSLAKPSTTAHAIPPIYSFDEADDYVYDVKWHPTHPALFGTVDGSGKFDLWNLNMDTEVPVVSTNVGSGRAINKVEWDRKEGRRVALGGSDGKLYVYDVGDMALARETEWTDLQKTVAGLAGGGQTNGVVEGDATRIIAGRLFRSHTSCCCKPFPSSFSRADAHSIGSIPGPIELTDEVLYANAHPSVSHMAPDLAVVFGDCIRLTREILYSKNAQPFLVAGSGTLGWDQVSANLVEQGEDVLVLNCGYFAEGFIDCLEAYGAKVDQLKAEIGGTVKLADVQTALGKKRYKLITITHVDTSTAVLSDIKAIADLVHTASPETLVVVDAVCSVASEEIQMDDWGIDVVLTATQKGLGTPPGLNIVVVSQKALKVFETRSTPVGAYYASWRKWLPIMKAYESNTAAYFATPPVNLIYAYKASLLQITQGPVTLQERFKAHKDASKRFKEVAKGLGFKNVPLSEEVSANGMTALYFPEGIVTSDIVPRLLKKGIVVAGGIHSAIKDKYFRVGHMGISVVDPKRDDIDKVSKALTETVQEARASKA